MKTLTKKYRNRGFLNFKKWSATKKDVLRLEPSRNDRKTQSYESLKFLYGESD